MQARLGYQNAGIVSQAGNFKLPVGTPRVATKAMTQGIGALGRLGRLAKSGTMLGALEFLLDPTMTNQYEDQEMQLINNPDIENYGYGEDDFNLETPLFDDGSSIRDLLDSGDYTMDEILGALGV
tara:strand:+ start:992 stop:1366 length:375 start_codon:yes stop_codon:yes gene_type:complete